MSDPSPASHPTANPGGREPSPGFLYTCRLAPDGTYTFDAPREEIERLYEFSPEEMARLLTAGQLPFLPDAGPELLASIRASAENLTPWVGDCRVVGARTGRERWVRVHAVPRREADGAVVWTGLITEITDLKAAQLRLGETVAELARSEARLRAALDGATMLGWDLDLVADRWETSADLTDFYGLPRGVDYSDPRFALAAVHPDDIPTVLAGRQRAIETDEPMRYEFRGRVPAPDGSTRWFATRGRVLRDDTGRAVRIVAVTTDVTERKRADEEREALGRQLLDAQKWESLGVLAGGVAHDFNNILTVVLGSAGLARRGLPPDSPALGHLDQIEHASRRAAELCRQMLAYAGRGPGAPGRAELAALVRESAPLLEVPASRAAIRFELDDGLPAIHADPSQVRQVLVNLVLNAAEAIGDGAGEIVVRAAAAEVPPGPPDAGFRLAPAAGRYARLSVTDTGPGLTPEVQARMFDPFFSTKFAGRGLGLAAVLGIVRAHKGGLRVDSAPGRGATFAVYWPTSAEPTPTSAATPPAPRARPSAAALVIDDEMYVREVTASALEEMGFAPLLAADGPSGVEVFRAHRDSVKLVVIDVVMPGMTGDQALEAIRALDPELPAVLTSGFTDRRVVRDELAARTEFLQKPFHPEELMAAVRRLVGSVSSDY